MDRDKMSNLYREPSIDASYQVSVHMAEGFQRRRLKCEKLTDYSRRTPSHGKSSPCQRQGELKTIIWPWGQSPTKVITVCDTPSYGHTKYNWPIWKDKKVMVRTSFAEKKQKKRKQKKWKRMKKIRLKQYASLRLKERHNNYECLNQSQGKYLDLIPCKN